MERRLVPGHGRPAAVSISELRARLAEMVGRAEAGEEIVILRGRTPVARLAPLREPGRRRLGLLREMLGADGLAKLRAAIAAPLSAEDQSAVEGRGTDALGISRR